MNSLLVIMLSIQRTSARKTTSDDTKVLPGGGAAATSLVCLKIRRCGWTLFIKFVGGRNRPSGSTKKLVMDWVNGLCLSFIIWLCCLFFIWLLCAPIPILDRLNDFLHNLQYPLLSFFSCCNQEAKSGSANQISWKWHCFDAMSLSRLTSNLC